MLKRILSGIRPIGSPHLGHLIGAIKPIIDMAPSSEKCLITIADLHVLHTLSDPTLIQKYIYEITATFIALGIDLSKTSIFRQSDITEIYQLQILLSNFATQEFIMNTPIYQSAVKDNLRQGYVAHQNITLGICMAPVLLAVETIMYEVDIVPLEKQINFAQTIVSKFNAVYGVNILTTPSEYIIGDNEIISGTGGDIMSISNNNYISIFGDSAELHKQIMRLSNDIKDPDNSTIYNLYKLFATDEEKQQMYHDMKNGDIGYGEAKEKLFISLDKYLEVPRKKYHELIDNTDELDKVLEEGAKKARVLAKKTIEKVTTSMLGKIK